MVEMLTAKDMQSLLQVDRSTIYRMSEAQQLPAIKVGKQWRFPADRVKIWLQQRSGSPEVHSLPHTASDAMDIKALLPLEHVQFVQDTFARTLDAMVFVADMHGHPIAEVSNPCGLFKIIQQTPESVPKFVEDWVHMDVPSGLKPKFIQNRLGLLGARGLIRVGHDLKGMVIVGGIAPTRWSPTPEEIADAAGAFGLSLENLIPHLGEVFYLDESQQSRVLTLVQRIADILAYTAAERSTLTGKLNAIAKLATI